MYFLLVGVGVGTKPPNNLQKYNWHEITTNGKRVCRHKNKIMSNKVVIITGNKGEGKSTKLKNIIDLLKANGVDVAGFVAVGEWRNGERSKYTLVDTLTNRTSIICTDVATSGYEKHGRFYFNPFAIKHGEQVLSNISGHKRVVVIDEIGPFELDGKVWHNSLVHHLKNTQNILLLSVRRKLVDEIIKKYNINSASVYTTQDSSDAIVKEIMQNVI